MKVALLTVTASIAAGAAVGLIDYHSNKAQAVLMAQRDTRLIALKLASRLNAGELTAIRAETDRIGPEYHEIQQKLAEAKDEFHLEEMPSVVRAASDDVEYVAVENGTDQIGSRAEVQPELRTALDLDSDGSSDVYHDAGGSWIASYAPIHDDRGNQAGVVIVKRPESAFEGGATMCGLRAAGAGTVVGLVMMAIAIMVMARVTTLLHQTRLAVLNMIENRSNSVPIQVSGDDESAQLARAVNVLSESWRTSVEVKPQSVVPQREIHKLRARIEQLSRELAESQSRLKGRQAGATESAKPAFRSSVAALQLAPLPAPPQIAKAPVLGAASDQSVKTPSAGSETAGASPVEKPPREEEEKKVSVVAPAEEMRLETAGGILVGEPPREEEEESMQAVPSMEQPIDAADGIPSGVAQREDDGEISEALPSSDICLETSGDIARSESPISEHSDVARNPELVACSEPVLETMQVAADPILDLSPSLAPDDEIFLAKDAGAGEQMPCAYVAGSDAGCDLRTVLEDALLNMDSEAAMRGLVFQVDVDERVPPIPFDALLVESALGELLAQAALAGKKNSEGTIFCTRSGKQCEVFVEIERDPESAEKIDLTRMTAFAEDLEGMSWIEEDESENMKLRLEFPLAVSKDPSEAMQHPVWDVASDTARTDLSSFLE